MTPNQRLILLLLLGLTVTSGTGTSLCTHEVMTRCVCNGMDIFNLENMLCLRFSELELRDSKLDGFELPIDLEMFSYLIQINKLTFNNVTMSFSFIGAVFHFLPSILNEINIISSTLKDVKPLQYPESLDASKIKALLLENTTVDPSLLQPSFEAFHRWLFGSLKSLGLVHSGLVEIDCNWAQRVQNLSHLDLSDNPISYTSLQNISQCSSLSFKSLKSLHLRNSSLTSLQSLCTPLSLTPALTQLDVSRNNFTVLNYPHCLHMKPLRMLNLSHSEITEVNSLLSESLEELDLSYNSLEVFNNQLQTLKRLDLSHNHLIRLPSLDSLSHLQDLKVDSNQLTILIQETTNLSTLEQLDSLYAGRNPYQCDCALKETIIFLNSTDSVSVEDYPEDFLCATPVAQQGTQIMNLSFEACMNSTNDAQQHSSPLCLTLFVVPLTCMIYSC